MIYVGLDNVDLNIQRVANRVAKGGHNIPTDAIIKDITLVEKISYNV